MASLRDRGAMSRALSVYSCELSGKQLQLLKEAVPSLSRVAVLSDPSNPSMRTK